MAILHDFTSFIQLSVLLLRNLFQYRQDILAFTKVMFLKTEVFYSNET